jgi:transporter family-2 protein
MSSTWLVVVITVIGGLAGAIQAQLAGVMVEKMGPLESVFSTYVLGGLLIGLIVAVSRPAHLSAWSTVPPWAFLAGVCGLVIVGSIAFGASRVGVVQALMTYTVSQFVFAAAIDHFGLLGAIVRHVETSRAIGLGLMLAGTWLVLR